MDNFIKRHGCNFGRFVVRTKINNERAKHDQLIKKKKEKIGII